MIKENNGVTLTNDEAMEIIAQLEGFNTLLCREILSTHLKDDEDDETMNMLRVIGNIGMIRVNDTIVNNIYTNTENITSCEAYEGCKLLIKQSIQYKTLVQALYKEAINENKN